LIKTPTLGWDAFKGASDVVAKGQRYVRAIQGDYDRKPPAAILLYGPPGTGKTTMATVIASQLADAITFFDVPKGTIQKPEQLKALFAIADERAPSVISFDEIGGFMSKAHTAMVPVITNSWKVVKQTGVQEKPLPYVLVIGTTNYPDRLDGAVLNRFGHDTTPKRSIEIGPPDYATRKEILTDHLKGVKNNLTEEDFDTLIELMDDSVGRDIATLVAEVASTVEDEFKTKTRVDEVISLADFQKQYKKEDAECTMAPESRAQFIGKLGRLLTEDKNPGKGPAEKVISVKYMVEKMLSDDHLTLLKAADIKKLRNGPNYFSQNTGKTQEKVFLNNLLTCLQKLSPSCTLVFNRAGREKVFLAGKKINVVGQLDKVIARKVQPDPTKDRARVWYFTHLSFQKDAIGIADAPTFWIPK